MRIGVLGLLLLAPAPAADGEAPPPLSGIPSGRAAQHLQLETRFDALLDAGNLRSAMERLASHPHHVGSPHGKDNAHWMVARFREWGYEAKIEVFHVLFPTPARRKLELVEPRRFEATLSEPVLQDRMTWQQSEQLPPYNAYSIDGDVTAELVYVHQGLEADYEELERRGIDVAGKIVIVRYGGSWRGIKPKIAAEKGAVGCILYSDPEDDGFYQGDVYPEGAFKNDGGVQRGSVLDMPLYPGDPLTPGVGATKDAERLSRGSARTLTRIPVLPISYRNALPLLAALEGPVAPAPWRGALPVTYHIGPGPAKVHLEVAFDWNLVPAYDVIARIDGSERPEQWIIRGNHHDAWVAGAHDPVSGLVAMLEEARAIGELVRAGWEPKRTIVYAAWDAEEPGLMGSTEWVETHADVLRDSAAVYINTDSNGRGFLRAGGSHTLEQFFNQVARDVIDPQKQISVLNRARARQRLRGTPQERLEMEESSGLRLGALGSGSDYTPFLQHLGVSSLNVGYGGENRGGAYHTAYDAVDHYTRFGDPDFAYGLTLARTTGRVVMRMADADVLPFDFRGLAETVARYVEELVELTDKMREETQRHNRLVAEGVYTAVADPRERHVPPEPREPVPHLNFSSLRNSVTRLLERTESYEELFSRATPSLEVEQQRELDRVLFRAERTLTRKEGLPDRPWFKHQIYAPGFYTGYGVKTLPGAREAIEQRRWNEAERQIMLAAKTLGRFTDQIDRAAKILERTLDASAAAEVNTE